MCSICVFAGTTEGRAVVSALAGQSITVTVCVATEYGETLLPPADNVTVSAQRLSYEEIVALLTRDRFDLLIDATHPYASVVTDNLVRACRETGTEYLRLLREAGKARAQAVYVPDMAAAAKYLSNTRGRILLTTGSKALAGFTGVSDLAERTYARVLPSVASLEACFAAGLKPSHVIAMQGPFSREANEALLTGIGAAYLVTKDSGSAGGFEEKIAAAHAVGAQVVVIGHPDRSEGLSLQDVLKLLDRRFGLHLQTEVALVGIGPGSRFGLTEEARSAIDGADCVIGAERMLETAARNGQARLEAIDPHAIADAITAHPEHRRVAVLLSGDVGFYSGAKRLLPLLLGFDTRVLPGVSALSCLCAKLNTSYEDVTTVSLHGRPRNIASDVRRHPRVFALLGGKDGATELCRMLVDAGLGTVRVSIGERLSYPDEKITVGTAGALSGGTYDALCCALIENPNAADGSCTFGLPDEAFERATGERGMIPMTKSEVRAVCLSKLRLTRDAVCWDVGAGTGSVSVEMARLATDGQVWAIECSQDAVRLIERNRERFALGDLHIVYSTAPEACEGLPAPTHVFIGGSSGQMHQIVRCAVAANPDVRIVITAVTLEAVTELTKLLPAFVESEIVCMTVARGRPAGAYHLMMGQNPVYICTLQHAANDPEKRETVYANGT